MKKLNQKKKENKQQAIRKMYSQLVNILREVRCFVPNTKTACYLKGMFRQEQKALGIFF